MEKLSRRGWLASPATKRVAIIVCIVVTLGLLLALLAGERWSANSKSKTHLSERDIREIQRQLAAGILPSMVLPGDSVVISPERLPPPINSSDIYISVLTAPVYHNKRFALQYLTWLQTVNLKNIRVITDSEDNQWIQAFKSQGGTVVIAHCPMSKIKKSSEMMCCKTGTQFDYWYRARETGKKYKWYCHVDDDLYLNIQTLVDTLKHYDPSKDCYVGNWKVLERIHKHKRIPASLLAPKLLDYTERKRDDFRYASGPAYCISETLMMKVEKYLRGKKFEENCKKSQVDMDDVLPGMIIDGVLGVDLNVMDEFKGQLDDIIYVQADDREELNKLKKEITIGMGGFVIKNGAFTYLQDPRGIFSYHCLLHPTVSWCNQRSRTQKL